MNDFNDTYDSYVNAQAEANECNKAIVFDALATASITSVKVTFDGAGDSGQIEDVTAFIADMKTEIPKTPIALERVTWGSGVRRSSDSVPLSDAVEDLCYGYLAQMYGGWENNDGAFGEFNFDIAKRTIEFEFNGRYTEYSTDNHTL